MDLQLAFRFGVAPGLGILLGLERQRTHGGDAAFAGVRTFTLISLLGASAAYLHSQFDLAWLGLAFFAAVAALTTVSYAITAQRGDIGITTEVTALLAFLISALCVWGQVGLAAALTVASLLLLSLREWLHQLAGRLAPADVEATLKFAIITVIIAVLSNTLVRTAWQFRWPLPPCAKRCCPLAGVVIAAGAVAAFLVG
jgi:uncharacterized membrane protein (DUF4010 family)